MQRRDALNPYLALALTLVLASALALALLRERPSTLWPSRSGAWFGAAAGGNVRLDRPAR